MNFMYKSLKNYSSRRDARQNGPFINEHDNREPRGASAPSLEAGYHAPSRREERPPGTEDDDPEILNQLFSENCTIGEISSAHSSAGRTPTAVVPTKASTSAKPKHSGERKGKKEKKSNEKNTGKSKSQQAKVRQELLPAGDADLMKSLEDPTLQSSYSASLKTSELPLIKRLLAMPLPKIIDPGKKGKLSKDPRIFNYMKNPVEQPGSIPHRSLNHYYVAFNCCVLHEEARAILQSSLDKWSDKLDVKFKELYSGKRSKVFMEHPDEMEGLFRCQVTTDLNERCPPGFFGKSFLYQSQNIKDPEKLLQTNDAVLIFPQLYSKNTGKAYFTSCFLAMVDSPPLENFVKGHTSSFKALSPALMPKTSPHWNSTINDAVRQINENPSCYFLAMKLQNFTTTIREYNSVRVAPRSMFWPLLTGSKNFARPAGTKKRGNTVYLPNNTSRPPDISKKLYRRLSSIYNVSQLASILYCIREQCIIRPAKGSSLPKSSMTSLVKSEESMEFDWALEGANNNSASGLLERSGIDVSLIQGPPGTGKTSTLLGIVSSILACSSSDEVPSNDNCNEDLESDTNAILSHINFEDADSATRSKMLQQRIKRKPKKNKAAPFGRVLVCAPSNEAVNELVRRLAGWQRNGTRTDVVGTWDKSGEPLRLRIVRIGKEERMCRSVQDLSLDAQVRSVISKEFPSLPSKDDLQELESEIISLERKLDGLLLRNGPTGRLVREDLWYEIADKKGKVEVMKTETKLRSSLEQVIQKEIIHAADVIAVTLGSSTNSSINFLETTVRDKTIFDAIVVDEACQATQITTSIPFGYFARKLVLIGDPEQLEATTFSTFSDDTGYKDSLFERLVCTGVPVSLLDEQYRMSPKISDFPNEKFYYGLLKDHSSVCKRGKMPYEEDLCFGASNWIDVRRNSKTLGRSLCIDRHLSKCNPTEAEVVTSLCKHLSVHYPGTDLRTVGIISPYRAQIDEIRNQLDRALGRQHARKIDVNTVDSFQGQEKDIIIISVVRSSELNNKTATLMNEIGFVRDKRRLNVAITRARRCRIIVGDSNCLLNKSTVWADFVRHCRKRGNFYSVNPVTAGNKGPMKVMCPRLNTMLKNGSYTSVLLNDKKANGDNTVSSRSTSAAHVEIL